MRETCGQAHYPGDHVPINHDLSTTKRISHESPEKRGADHS